MKPYPLSYDRDQMILPTTRIVKIYPELNFLVIALLLVGGGKK